MIGDRNKWIAERSLGWQGTNQIYTLSQGHEEYRIHSAIFTFLVYLLKSPIVNHWNVMKFTFQ